VKIAIVVAAFPPRSLAGTELATYNTAKHLAKLGHEVHVVTALDQGLASETIEEGFYLHRGWALRRSNLFTLTFLIPAFLKIRQINPDVVHAQSASMGLIALLVKKLLRKPYVIYSRAELYDSWLFRAPVAKQVLRNADRVIALTEDMKRSMAEFYTGDVCVIPNGVELERFSVLSKKEARDRLKIADKDKIVLFVGRLRPQKNVACLIEAMKTVTERDPKVKLLIVGEGPEGDGLRKMTSRLGLDEHVDFVATVPPEGIPAYMAAADVFVLPSLFEGFPNVILEAMAAGLPIVATRVSGLWETVVDGMNGFLVDSGSPQQVAEKAIFVLENHGISEEMAKSNRTKAAEFSWHAVASKLEQVYTTCMLPKDAA